MPDDDLEIPAFLRRTAGSVRPTTVQPVEQPTVVEVQTRRPWDQPKGMTDDEYREMKAQLAAAAALEKRLKYEKAKPILEALNEKRKQEAAAMREMKAKLPKPRRRKK